MTYREYFQYLHKNDLADPLTNDGTMNPGILEDFNSKLPDVLRIKDLHKKRELQKLREAMEHRE